MYSVEVKNNKEIYDFCMINGITDINKFIQECFKQGFDIKRYGFLGGTGEKEVVVEKTVEVPIEVIKEIEKIVEVIKEVPVDRAVIQEVVKEVPVETIVEKIIQVSDDTQINELLLKIQQLESDKQLFSDKTTEMENNFQDKMSKKEQELDELRHSLDEHLAKPPIEKIVEVVVEKEITDNSSKSKLDALQNTLAKVRQETLEKDKKIRELEQTIQEIQKFQDNKQAVYLKGSNLDDKLYK